MQQELRRLAKRLANPEDQRLKPVLLEARVGVHSGEVVMRTVETGDRVEYTPVGYVANLAARMQTVAPSGGIAISEETHRGAGAAPENGGGAGTHSARTVPPSRTWAGADAD